MNTVFRSVSGCCLIAVILLASAHADMTSGELLKDYDLTPDEIRRLENGEVLAFSDEEIEFSKRELATDAMVKVDTDHSTVLDAMQEDATLIPVKLLKEHHRIDSEADFEGVGFTDAEYDEVEKLLDVRPGKDFNLSGREILALRERLKPYRDATRAEQIAAVSDAMRDVLIERYDAYREQGIAGIAPYQRTSKKRVDVGAELQLTNDAAVAFEDEFPEFVRALMQYPEGADCCEHEYRWLKVRIRKRIAFALSHTMIQSTDDYALITERYFYIGNTINSVQLTVIWIPYEDGGSVGVAVSASADVLDSMMGRMLRGVGRNMAKDMVSDTMLDIKTDLEDRGPGAEVDPEE